MSGKSLHHYFKEYAKIVNFNIFAFMKKLLLIASMLISLGCQAKVDQYVVKVVNEYPHDVKSYTQGLFFKDGVMYESTGQWGESTFRIVNLKTGKAEKKLDFDRKYFLEGSIILGDNLYILTWTNKVVFVYDAVTLKYKQTYSYPREGWGLTTDGENLIASDGSDRIYFLDPNLKLKKTIHVKLNGKAVKYINEMEMIDGKIWANVYMTDMILIINPENGEVTGQIDCTGLLPKELRTPSTDVLNGIAVNDGRIYLTGKYWPRVYEIQLQKRR